MSHVNDLVISLSAGPCTCVYGMGRCTASTYDPTTGEVNAGSFDAGPCTHRCLRCQARGALDADGVAYKKVDAVPPFRATL